MPYDLKANALSNAILALMHGQAEDSFCYRNLIDNLYAFRTGAVNKIGKWDTNRIKNNCHWTPAATLSSKVEKEHVVPMAELVRILLCQPIYSIEKVNAVIDKYCPYCMVTPEEHRILNKNYQRRMPDEFWSEDSNFYMDAWSRYKLSGIAIDL